MNEHATYGDIVVSPHAAANQSGLAVLAQGGNAVDAAIATNATLGVIAPETCGLGGDLFAIVLEPGAQTPAVLNASGRAGSGADPAALKGHESIPINHELAVTIPGCVDGWLALSERFGALPLDNALAPAIQLARYGFPSSGELSDALAGQRAGLEPQLASAGMYPAGVERGARISRFELARTLERISSGDRSEFYAGAVAEAISLATDRTITLPDMERSQADWIAPLRTELWGRTAWTVPPNSQGYLSLATAKIFESLGAPRDHEDPRYRHLMIEAYRSVAQERDRILGDPDAMTGIDLLSEERLMSIAAMIDPSRASLFPAPDSRMGGTAYMCVVDRAGLAISLIQSNFHGIGSGIGVHPGGFFLHSRGSGFTLTPEHPNTLGPHKRPLHTLSPTLWTRGDRLDMLLGTRGGHQQPQIIAQMAALMLRGGLSPGEAQHVARWTTATIAAGTNSNVRVEGGVDTTTVAWLRDAGHQVEIGNQLMPSAGPVSVISQSFHGLRIGGCDPRTDTSAVSIN